MPPSSPPGSLWTRCFSTLGCGQCSLPEVLALAQRFDVPALELRGLDSRLDLPAYWRSQDIAPVALAAVVAESGCTVPMLATSFRLIGSDAAQRQTLLTWVPWAEALGVPYLRVFDGGDELGLVEPVDAEATLHWWRALRDQMGWQVDLAIETHDSLLRAEAVQHLIARVGPFPILWDAHHTWRRGGMTLNEAWDSFGSHVVHIHYKDSVAHPHRSTPTYVLPGKGEFPFPTLRALLARSHYTGALSLEWERWWRPELPPVEEALAAAANGWW